MKAHWLDEGGDISPEALARNDIFYSRIDTAPERYRAPLDEVKVRREYVEEDVIELAPSTPNLDAICAKFVDEHYHDDDEVRFEPRHCLWLYFDGLVEAMNDEGQQFA